MTTNLVKRGVKFKLPIAHRLMSAPAVWGKLPTHADFITHAMKSGHTHAWTHWLSFNAPQTKIEKPTDNENSMHYRKPVQQTWVSTAAPVVAVRGIEHAISFILPPEELLFSKTDYVVGVMFNSMDKVGRKHPFIVYATARKRWLKQYWDRPHHVAQDWQFWLGQLIQHAFKQSVTLSQENLSADALNTANNTLQTQLLSSIQQLWQLHAPRWMQFLLFPAKHPTAQQCQSVINAFILATASPNKALTALSSSTLDQTMTNQAKILRGVQRMPWADWPYRMWRASSKGAFWQQDDAGGYINAAEKLSQLRTVS